MNVERLQEDDTIFSNEAASEETEPNPQPWGEARQASSIRPKKQKWIIEGIVPANAITIVTGRGGVGKSTLAAAIAGHATKGSDMLPRSKGEVSGRVAWFGAEESVTASTVPKLRAAGCMMQKIYFPGIGENGENATDYNFATDSYRIESILRSMDARLCVVDPLISFCQSVDVNNGQAMRSVLRGLSKIGERIGVAWVLIVHPNKSRRGTIVERIGGSGAITQCSRSVVCLHQFPSEPDSRYLFHCKTNCGPLWETALMDFQLSPRNNFPVLKFVEWSTKSVDDMDGDSEDGVEGDVMKDALQLLRKMCEHDYVPAVEAMKEAKNAGIGERTLRKAKLSLGIIARRISEGANSGFWEWGFPEKPESD